MRDKGVWKKKNVEISSLLISPPERHLGACVSSNPGVPMRPFITPLSCAAAQGPTVGGNSRVGKISSNLEGTLPRNTVLSVHNTCRSSFLRELCLCLFPEVLKAFL